MATAALPVGLIEVLQNPLLKEHVSAVSEDVNSMDEAEGVLLVEYLLKKEIPNEVWASIVEYLSPLVACFKSTTTRAKRAAGLLQGTYVHLELVDAADLLNSIDVIITAIKTIKELFQPASGQLQEEDELEAEGLIGKETAKLALKLLPLTSDTKMNKELMSIIINSRIPPLELLSFGVQYEKADKEGDVLDDEDERRFSVKGLAHFAYLILVEKLEADKLPAIISAPYLAQVCDPLYRALMQDDDDGSGAQKAAKMLITLARPNGKLAGLTFAEQAIAAEPAPTVQLFIHHMISTENAEVRNELGMGLRSYFSMCDAAGRYLLYATLLQSCPHPNAVYMLILWVKEEVMKETESGKLKNTEAHFTGKKLMQLLGLVMHYDNKSSRQIMEDYDKAASVANLILFCLLRGPRDLSEAVHDNLTGIWEETILDHLETIFLRPVERACKEEKSEAERIMKEVVCRPCSSEGESKEIDEMEQKSEQARKRGAQELIFKIDMLEITLTRLRELMKEGAEHLS
eukprot:m.76287 g.76287  ORF g.76287 m.76287 type:complete len:517 (+) comp12549_c0_seq2:139-1689(+)